MYFQSAAHTRRFYIYIYIYKERKKTQIQVSESCSLFMCNYQCISTGCAIIFIVTFIHVMPLLIWFRYELLTVTVPVVKGEGGGEKSSTSQRAKNEAARSARKSPRITPGRLRKPTAEMNTSPPPNFHHSPHFFNLN